MSALLALVEPTSRLLPIILRACHNQLEPRACLHAPAAVTVGWSLEHACMHQLRGIGC